MTKIARNVAEHNKSEIFSIFLFGFTKNTSLLCFFPGEVINQQQDNCVDIGRDKRNKNSQHHTVIRHCVQQKHLRQQIKGIEKKYTGQEKPQPFILFAAQIKLQRKQGNQINQISQKHLSRST